MHTRSVALISVNEYGNCVYTLNDCVDRSDINREDISDDRLEKYNEQIEQYSQYLKDKEQQILNERGISTQNSISNVRFNKLIILKIVLV